MSVLPKLPKGMRDFPPQVMIKRKYITDIIRDTYTLYGFQPMETPAMESLEVLMDKYGEEGDKLLFKVLNSGEYLNKVKSEDLEGSISAFTRLISEKGLKYDLTVPFARYIAGNRDTTLPFKRYQIQPVWRADRPQKGRYREFVQCDADVIGTKSLLCEVEILQMIQIVLEKLGIQKYTIKVNHRRLLEGLLDKLNKGSQLNEFSQIIDKLDKTSWEKVASDLNSIGFTADEVAEAQRILFFQHKNDTDKLVDLLPNENGSSGLNDVNYVFSMVDTENVELDLSLARGLSYYTGMIFEVKIENSGVGSVGGGGRYDDLTSNFGYKDISGVGFSFGLDRLYDSLENLNLFPEEADSSSTQLLFVHFDEASYNHAINLSSMTRNKGIPTEVYPDQSKMKKQLQYGNKKNIPFVVLIGEDERTSGLLTMKNMVTGQEKKLSIEEIIELVVA